MNQGDYQQQISTYDGSKSIVTTFTTSQVYLTSTFETNSEFETSIVTEYQQLEAEIAALMTKHKENSEENCIIFDKGPHLKIEQRGGEVQIKALFKNDSNLLEISTLQQQNESLREKIVKLQSKLHQLESQSQYKGS